MYARCTGQIACRPGLGGHREDVAAGLEQGTLAVRRDLEGVDILADLPQRGPAARLIFQNVDRHLGGFLGRQVEAVNVPRIFEHDGGIAQ